MKSKILSSSLLLLFVTASSVSSEGENSDEKFGKNSTAHDIIAQAMESDNEVVQSLSPPDFLFNSCGMEKYKPSQEFSQNYPYYLSGFDLEGRPIWVGECGKFDLKTVTSRGQQGSDELEAYMKDVIFNFIRSLFLKPTPGRPTFQFTFIVDMEGFPEDQITLENVQFIKRLSKQYLRLINEYAYAIVLLNVNSPAEKLGEVFKPIFGENTENIEIFGTDKSTWLPYMTKMFPKDQIAGWYGGNPNFKPFRVYP